MARRDGAIELPSATEAARYAGLTGNREGVLPEARSGMRLRCYVERSLRLASDPRRRGRVGRAAECGRDLQPFDGIVAARRADAGRDRVARAVHRAAHENLERVGPVYWNGRERFARARVSRKMKELAREHPGEL